MKAILLLLALVVTAFDAASAQQPTQPPRPRPVPQPQDPFAPGRAQEEIELTRNYRLTVTFKTTEKDSRDVTVLTSASKINLNTPLAAGDPTLGMITAEVSGVLTEKEDGHLRFSYRVGAQIPLLPDPSPAPAANGNFGQGRNLQYYPESVTGVLTLEPGKPYEIFKSGARSYTITISPDTADKKK